MADRAGFTVGTWVVSAGGVVAVGVADELSEEMVVVLEMGAVESDSEAVVLA